MPRSVCGDMKLAGHQNSYEPDNTKHTEEHDTFEAMYSVLSQKNTFHS